MNQSTNQSININQSINQPVIHVAENDSKQHLTHAEDDRDFHLERVEKRDLVSGRLPRLTAIHTALHYSSSNPQEKQKN